MTLEQYYYTTIQEYYLKVDAYNERRYIEMDMLRTIQFEQRLHSQCLKASDKPKKPSDLYRLPIDGDNIKSKRQITMVTKEQVKAMAEMGYNIVNKLWDC